jgi:DNA-directed DNA polymerase III PolC
MEFVHLHCHSAYSLMEGTATPQALVTMARKLKMPALALTDRNNMYAVVPFYTQALKAGIKPILGMEVDLDDGFSLVLLARNMAGYSNLCHLSTVLRLNSDPETFPPAGFDDESEDGAGEYGEICPWDPGVWGVSVFGFTSNPDRVVRHASMARPHKVARLPRELLLSGRHARGLIALSGGRRGLVNSLVREGKLSQAARSAGMLLSAFGEGNFFIEIDAHNERDVKAMVHLANIANDLGVPIVAANDVLYLRPQDGRTALALAAARKGGTGFGLFLEPPLYIKEGGQLHANPSIEEEVGTERYFKSREDMAAIFKDYPQAIANTQFIAEECNVELPLHKPLFPSVKLRQKETPFSRLWKLCFAGATRLYQPLIGEVLTRLRHELEIIESLGFCEYFLVVYDIVRFAHSRHIPILARGSAANSLVAYVLGITQVDPLQHDLLFERFLNPSRAEFELPDIDLDLCWRRRDEVLHYVYEHYGRNHVAIVGTHITFRLRSAWREMAKALGISPERINRVAHRLPNIFAAEDLWEDPREVTELGEVVEAPDREYDRNFPGTGINADIENTSVASNPTPKFRDERERVAYELCQAIEGLPRHAGMHCAGVIISPGETPIADLVPLQRASRDPSMAITQFNKDAIEEMGLVKMDLLGSRALTTLVDTLQSSGIAQGKGNVAECLATIPFDDERTYAMMAEGNTLGCFQLESPGMRGLLKWLRPRSLNDIAAAVSLFRPGPLQGGFLETFMRRHIGQEPVEYLHPSMEQILKETKGVILYQEQFLQLAHTLAGLNLGEAERLRKDLGKARSPEERTRLGTLFVAGAIERGVGQLQAEKTWEIIAGYTGFGFCKAHACSYALTAYRSAYMKAHYPAHFIAAQINNQGGYYGPSVYVEDARRLRITLLPPHVNESGTWCEVPQKSRAIRFGLQFVKGLSEKSIAAILTERLSGGRFRSLMELMSRVNLTPPEVTALVKVGACDDLEDASTDKGSVSIPSIASMRGRLGEVIEAVYEPKMRLNRKQMVWLLPALVSSRQRVSRQARQRVQSGWGRTTATGTGTNGQALQMAIGDILQYSAHADRGTGTGLGGSLPKILGKSTLRIDVPDLDDYAPTEKLRLEQETLGFALSHNEMEWLEVQGAILSSDLHLYAERDVKVAGVAVAGRRHMGRDGKWMLFLSIQDREGLIEVVLFHDAYQASGKALTNGGYGPYVITGRVQVDGTGRGIGVLPPAGLRSADEVAMKMHAVVIGAEVLLMTC